MAAAAGAPPPGAAPPPAGDGGGRPRPPGGGAPPPGRVPPAAAPPPTPLLLAASAAAGVLSRCVVHPLDTIRARMMVARAPAAGAAAAAAPSGCVPPPPPAAPRGLLATARSIAAADGARGFYRGLSVSAAMQAPAVATYLSTYDGAKAALAARVAAAWPAAAGGGGAAAVAAHPATHLAAGVVAEAVSAVFWVPMEVLKQRAQVRGGGGADATAAGVLRDLLRAEGARGLFRGYALTVGVFGPYSAIYFVAYERGKRGWAAALERRGGRPAGTPLPLYAVVSAAAASGAVAAAATSPLDVVKTRIQTQGDVGGRAGGATAGRVGAAGGATPPAAAAAAATTTPTTAAAAAPPPGGAYTSTAHAVRRIVAEEGARGLCRGLTARVLWIMPGTAITMGAFETLKARLQARE